VPSSAAQDGLDLTDAAPIPSNPGYGLPHAEAAAKAAAQDAQAAEAAAQEARAAATEVGTASEDARAAAEASAVSAQAARDAANLVDAPAGTVVRTTVLGDLNNPASEIAARVNATVLPAKVRQRNAVRRSNGGTITTTPKPAWFTWQAAPINIFKAGHTYLTDFDAAKFKHTSGKTWYVHSVNGVDTNAGTSEAAPVKTLLKAYQLASSGDTILTLDRGVVHREHAWNGQRIRKSLNLIAKHPGETVYSYSSPLTYTLTTGRARTYQAARSNVGHVIEWGAFAAANGVGYTQRTSVAEVETNPGSWHNDGTTLYVHTLDGTAPDNSKHLALLVGTHFYQDSESGDCALYMEGITVLGGSHGMTVDDTVGNADLYAKNCRFLWASGLTAAYGNSVNVTGARYAYFQGCTAANSRKDGFNYTAYNLAGALRKAPRFIEVDCHAYSHGTVGTLPGAEDTNNASTAHAGSQGIRINGVYHETKGAVIGDVHTGTQTLNYGNTVFDSKGSPTNNQGIAAQQAGAEVGVYGGMVFGNSYDLYAVTGTTMHADSVEYDTITGNGTKNITNPL
jgi:hypothetical protein